MAQGLYTLGYVLLANSPRDTNETMNPSERHLLYIHKFLDGGAEKVEKADGEKTDRDIRFGVALRSIIG